MTHDERIWVLDTESNGEHPGEIIELAAVEMIGLKLTGRYREWRFRPRTPVHYRATRVHGITDRDLRHCPRIEQHIPEIRALLGSHAIAGHAVHVEVAALQRVMPDWAPSKAYDTLRLVRKVYPDLERHRLSSMGDHLDLSRAAGRMTSNKAHSAFYDAVLCGLILRNIMEPLDAGARTAMAAHFDTVAIGGEKQARANARAAVKEARRTHAALRPGRVSEYGPSAIPAQTKTR